MTNYQSEPHIEKHPHYERYRVVCRNESWPNSIHPITMWYGSEDMAWKAFRGDIKPLNPLSARRRFIYPPYSRLAVSGWSMQQRLVQHLMSVGGKTSMQIINITTPLIVKMLAVYPFLLLRREILFLRYGTRDWRVVHVFLSVRQWSQSKAGRAIAAQRSIRQKEERAKKLEQEKQARARQAGSR